MLVTLAWALSVITVFFAIFVPLMIIKPVIFMKLFGISSESQIEIAKKMVPIPLYTFAIGNMCMFFVNFFVAVGKPFYSSLNSLVQLISTCVTSKILAVKFPDDPMKQMFSYTISDLVTVVLTTVLSAITLIPLIKKSKNPGETLLTSTMNFH